MPPLMLATRSGSRAARQPWVSSRLRLGQVGACAALLIALPLPAHAQTQRGPASASSAAAAHSSKPGLRPTPAPLEASLIIASPSALAAMAGRLQGQRVRRGDGVLVLDDVAGQGRPWIGIVAVRCGHLWLDTAVVALRLTGPLARMRIAGPGYLVWAVGRRRPQGDRAASADPPHTNDFELTRLGVLARPETVAPGTAAAASVSAALCESP